MKRIASIFLSALLLICCTACGADSTDEVAVLTYRLEQAELRLAEAEEKLEQLEEMLEQTKSAAADLTAADVQTPVQDAEAASPATVPAELNELQGSVYNVLADYRKNAAYIKIADEPERIELLHAAHYQLGKFSGYEIDLLLISVAVNNNLYGVDAGRLLVDRKTGQVYDMVSLDVNNYAGELGTYEDMLTAILSGYTSYMIFDDAVHVYSDAEIMTELTADEIAALNSRLNP